MIRPLATCSPRTTRFTDFYLIPYLPSIHALMVEYNAYAYRASGRLWRWLTARRRVVHLSLVTMYF